MVLFNIVLILIIISLVFEICFLFYHFLDLFRKFKKH